MWWALFWTAFFITLLAKAVGGKERKDERKDDVNHSEKGNKWDDMFQR